MISSVNCSASVTHYVKNRAAAVARLLPHANEVRRSSQPISIDNNPSFGNKEGGLSTIYEKSLGAVAKGGQSPLAAVYKYAEPITASGFCFTVKKPRANWRASVTKNLPPGF